MNDYEKINANVKANVIDRRNEAIKQISAVLAKLLLALGLIIALKAIGFISGVFMVILTAITVCFGAFKSGWICRDIFR